MHLKKLKSSVVFISFIGLLLVSPFSVLGSGNLKVAFPEFYPFFAENNKGEVKGFFHDIVNEAGKRMGKKIEWYQMPWKRCQVQVKIGHFDAMVTVPTRERMEYCSTHKDPFYRKELKLFTYKSHPLMNRIRKIKTIKDIKTGGFSVITYSGNGWNKRNVAGIGIKTLETSQVHYVFRMLAARRGDLVIEWPMGAIESIKKTRVKDEIVKIDVALNSMPFHLLISKKSPVSFNLELFNKIVNKMNKDGVIKRIVASYFKTP